MPDNEEALKLVEGVGLDVFDTVSSIMTNRNHYNQSTRKIIR
jgi:hypothetical protein